MPLRRKAAPRTPVPAMLPRATPASRNAGSADASSDGAAPEGGAACVDAATRCSLNGVETCASGKWGSVVPCPSATPSCIGGVCREPPSCQASDAGTAKCGAANDSCCSSLEVPGGTFYRSYNTTDSTTEPDAGWPDLTGPATVSSFRLDKYPVTVGRFRQFVAAWKGGSGYLPPAGSGVHTHVNGGQGLADSSSAGSYETGWLASDDSNVSPTNANLACDPTYGAWTSTAGANETLPMNCVNWPGGVRVLHLGRGLLAEQSRRSVRGGRREASSGCSPGAPRCPPARGPGVSTRSRAATSPRRAPRFLASGRWERLTMGVTARWGQLDLGGEGAAVEHGHVNE